VKETVTGWDWLAESVTLAGLGEHPVTPVPEHTAASVYVVCAVPVFVTVKLYDDAVFGANAAVPPSGVTDAAGLTTVSLNLPVADAPVGVVAVTKIETLPEPADPVVNDTDAGFEFPAAMMPIVGHAVMDDTATPGVHVTEYRVSMSPVFVTVKVTWFPVVFASRIVASG